MTCDLIAIAYGQPLQAAKLTSFRVGRWSQLAECIYTRISHISRRL